MVKIGLRQVQQSAQQKLESLFDGAISLSYSELRQNARQQNISFGTFHLLIESATKNKIIERTVSSAGYFYKLKLQIVEAQ